jgi:hypothetical protein
LGVWLLLAWVDCRHYCHNYHELTQMTASPVINAAAGP